MKFKYRKAVTLLVLFSLIFSILHFSKSARAANSLPVATTPSSISQVTDGTGYITFSTAVSDDDNDNTRLKVEYSDDGGSTWYDPYLVSATPSSETVDLDNDQTYQIGSSDAIKTSTGAITLTIVWDTQSVLNGNGSLDGTRQTDIKVRVIPNDILIPGSDFTETDNTTAAFNGTNSNTQAISNSIQLSQTSSFAKGTTTTFPSGESWAQGMAISGSYAYVSLYTQPVKVKKVLLSNLSIAGTTTFNAGENNARDLVVDGSSGYVTLDYASGPKVGKFNTSTMARTGVLSLATGEDPHGITSDGTNGYICSNTSPIKLVKFTLSSMGKVGSTLTLDSGENGCRDLTNDGTYLYVPTRTSPAQVVRVKMSDLTRVDVVSANAGESWSESIHMTGGNIYLGTQAYVVKFDASAMTRTGAVARAAAATPYDIVSDVTYLYSVATGYVNKIRLSDFSSVGETNISITTHSLGVSGGQLYGGSQTDPGQIYDIDETSVYSLSGTYTHSEQDISSATVIDSSDITFVTTTDADTSVSMEMIVSTDGGGSWGSWTSVNSGDSIPGLTKGTNVSNYLVQWRANLLTSDASKTPSLDSVTVNVYTKLGGDGTTQTSSNFEVDNKDPTGFTNFQASNTTATTITLMWDVASDDNFDHYEMWYGTNSTDVVNRGGTAQEWSTAKDSALGNISTITTTITDLTPDTTYYLLGWAVDAFGNELVAAGGTPKEDQTPTNTPTPTPTSAVNPTATPGQNPTSTPAPTQAVTPTPTPTGSVIPISTKTDTIVPVATVFPVPSIPLPTLGLEEEVLEEGESIVSSVVSGIEQTLTTIVSGVVDVVGNTASFVSSSVEGTSQAIGSVLGSVTSALGNTQVGQQVSQSVSEFRANGLVVARTKTASNASASIVVASVASVVVPAAVQTTATTISTVSTTYNISKTALDVSTGTLKTVQGSGGIRQIFSSFSAVVNNSFKPLYASSMTSFLSFFGLTGVGVVRSKRRTWGLVYDSVTKQPVRGAFLTLYSQSGNLLTTVSNQDGRFSFLPEKEDNYQLRVEKSGFIFPSQIITANIDGLIGHVYTKGERFNIQNDDPNIKISVPLDSRGKKTQKALRKINVKVGLIWDNLALPLLIGFLALSIFSLLIVPNFLNSALFTFYFIMTVVNIRQRIDKARSWGIIENNYGKRLTNATIKLYKEKDDGVKGDFYTRTSTNGRGRYQIVPEYGTYILEIEHPEIHTNLRTIDVSPNHPFINERLVFQAK